MIVEYTVRYNPERDGDKAKEINEAPRWQHAMWDLDQELRKKIKYEEHPDAVAEAYEQIRTFLYDTLREHNVSFDM